MRYDPKELTYEVVHRSDAVILCEASELDQYSRRLAQLTPILEQSDGQRRMNMLVSWCLECARAPATRGEGVYGLQYLRSHPDKPHDLLNKTQKDELVDLLVAENPPARSAVELVGLLESFPSDKLDRYLLASLPECHNSGWSDVARFAVQILPRRLGVTLDAATKARIEQYWQDEGNGYQNDEVSQRLNVLWGFICGDVWSQCRKPAAKL